MTYQNPYQQYFPQYNQQIPQYNQQFSYNPSYQVQNQAQPQQQQIQNPKFDIIQGELAANMYPTENGQEVILVDMDNPYVYRKKRSTDGKLDPIIKYKLVPEENTETNIDLSGFVKQDDLDKIIENAVKVEVEKRLSQMTLKPSTARKKNEE